MKFIFFISFIIFFLNGYCQVNFVYSGRVVDDIKNIGIPNVHVFTSGNENIGSVSNADGDFILKSRKRVGSIYFSHLEYQLKSFAVKEEMANGIIVKLSPSNVSLKEVIIEDVSAQEIVQKAIEHLKENHFVEPVYYSFFSRIENIEDGKLSVLEEHTGYIKQLKNHNTMFALLKNRMKAFTELGKQISTSVSMVRMTEMYTDNMGKYLEDYLKKGEFKKYQFQFRSEEEIFGRTCYVIHYSISKDIYDNEGLLFVDKENYGILKKKTIGKSSKEITFKLINGKYYLSSTFYTRKYKGTEQKRTTIYNVNNEGSSFDYISRVHIGPKKAKKFVGNFNDDYWDNLNFVPLNREFVNQLKISTENN